MPAHCAIGLVAASYLTYTLAATGLSKLRIYGSSTLKRHRFDQITLNGSGWVIVGCAELLSVASAILCPQSRGPVAVVGALFAGFLAVNLTTWLRGRNEAPCRCAGVERTGSRAAERAVANIVCLALVALWASSVQAFPPGARLVLLTATLAPLAQALIARATGRQTSANPDPAALTRE